MLPDHHFRVQAGKKRIHVRAIETWPVCAAEGGQDPTEVRTQLTIPKAEHLIQALQTAIEQVKNGGDMVIEV